MTEGQLFDAAAAHYRWWQKAHGGERVYGYGFYTPPCVESAGAVVFSEEGLQQVVDRYRKHPAYATEPRRELTRSLRWSPADSPYCRSHDGPFEGVNETLAVISETTHALGADDPRFVRHINALYSALIGALRRFRVEVLAGGERPLLSVWFGDQSEEEIAYFVRNCNAPSVADWYFKTVSEHT
jgi:hypothetical protein